MQALTAAENAFRWQPAAGEAVLKMDFLRRPELLRRGATLPLEKAPDSGKKLIKHKLSACPGGGAGGGQTTRFSQKRPLQLLQGRVQPRCRIGLSGRAREPGHQFSIGCLALLEGCDQLVPQRAERVYFLFGAFR